MAAISALAILVGCSPSRPVEVPHDDEVEFTRPLPTSKFVPPYNPSIGVMSVRLSEVTVDVPIAGRRSDLIGFIQLQFAKTFSGCRNFTFARDQGSHSPATGVSDLAPRLAPSAATGPAVSDLQIRIAVTELERDSRVDVDKSQIDAGLAGNGTTAHQTRAGKVELEFTVFRGGDSTPAYVYRTSAPLVDERSTIEQDNPLYYYAATKYRRTSEGEGVRSAVEQGLLRLHASLVKGVAGR